MSDSDESDRWTVTTIIRGPGNLEHYVPLTIKEPSEQMNIEDVKRERLKLADDIGILITSFEERTGVSVKGVELDQFLTVDSDIPVKTEVKIKLEL